MVILIVSGYSVIMCWFHLFVGMEFPAGEINASTWTKIGSGGFGDVSTGFIRHTKVAVKFLSNVSECMLWRVDYRV